MSRKIENPEAWTLRPDDMTPFSEILGESAMRGNPLSVGLRKHMRDFSGRPAN